MDTDSPFVLALVLGGLALNLIVSTGALWKLIDFARRWGVIEERLETHDREIQLLREDSHCHDGPRKDTWR